MDLSFDLKNMTGDHIRVALSDYDRQIVEIFSKDPFIQNLNFYNISLERIKKKSKYVNPVLLYSICEFLLNFIKENPNTIYTYLCDAGSEIERHHSELTPQEYRSNLFSKLFDYYTFSNGITDYLDELIYIPDSADKNKDTYVHFIYNKVHHPRIKEISKIILEK